MKTKRSKKFSTPDNTQIAINLLEQSNRILAVERQMNQLITAFNEAMKNVHKGSVELANESKALTKRVEELEHLITRNDKAKRASDVNFDT